MNNITLNKKILSPLQPRVKSVIDVRGEHHPVREEVKRLCGSPFTLEISFQEDTETIKNLKVPGLVGILCTLKLAGQIIAFGRSVSVFSKLNKYLDRTISSSINGSFLSATNNAVKILESIRANGSEGVGGFEEPEMTDKQKDYLNRLVAEVDDEDEREQYFNQINSGLSRQDASDLIASLVPVR